MLAWLSLWGKVQICIWPSWCPGHSLSLASVKSRLVLVTAHPGNPGQSPEGRKTDLMFAVTESRCTVYIAAQLYRTCVTVFFKDKTIFTHKVSDVLFLGQREASRRMQATVVLQTVDLYERHYELKLASSVKQYEFKSVLKIACLAW